ncbi:MAG TPA: nitrilase-related carbon-nitrogen hydrolase [Gemmatimonadota bacterium]|nr:nitrilase-related carbon-nitrogen hydrolase [Gemmatimonadota bacterium]
MRRSVALRVVQHAPALGDVEANLADHAARVEAAAVAGAELVLFSELSLTGYALFDLVDVVALDPGHALWPDVLGLSEAVDVVVGYVERGEDGFLYNSAAYLHAGELLHNHRKTYLPTYGPFDEGRFYSPGDRIEAFDAPWGRAALVVCEELWHPSVVHGAVALGATALLATANAPGRGPVEGAWANQGFWREIARVYARLYSVDVALASRVGYEERFLFGGASGIWGPDGEPRALAGPLEEETLDATLDAETWRRSRVANPSHGIERPELLMDALRRAGAP